MPTPEIPYSIRLGQISTHIVFKALERIHLLTLHKVHPSKVMRLKQYHEFLVCYFVFFHSVFWLKTEPYILTGIYPHKWIMTTTTKRCYSNQCLKPLKFKIENLQIWKFCDNYKNKRSVKLEISKNGEVNSFMVMTMCDFEFH